jgi:hypothetical protein
MTTTSSQTSCLTTSKQQPNTAHTSCIFYWIFPPRIKHPNGWQQSNTEHQTAKNNIRKCHNIANIKNKAENKMRAWPRPPKFTLFRLLTLYGLIVGSMALRCPSDDVRGLAEPQSMAVAKTQKSEGQWDPYVKEKKESRCKINDRFMVNIYIMIAMHLPGWIVAQVLTKTAFL